ncbi:hypothetical protein [Actinomycetospora sp. CA-084318]|uniref:hypothetical protein n=1 Tax=Actinomycetospora sp. CA-084318 TaxID=3239892 RepID=UPI003D95AD80
MAVFGQVRRDLKDRKNLDIYTSVGVALVASALSVFDILPPDKTTSAVMAILAVVAFNQLVTRSIAERAAESHGDVFRAQFSPDLVPKRASAESLYLAGVTMGRTIRESYGALEISLRRGAHVRILLTDPDADDAALDARCQISRPTPDEIKVEFDMRFAS